MHDDWHIKHIYYINEKTLKNNSKSTFKVLEKYAKRIWIVLPFKKKIFC